MSALPFSTATGADVRVRFCPSPTGTPHVGMVRTALFNWAYARHTGGTMVFRIEDTDAARDSEESYLQLIDALTWLGIDWDEGVEIGGPHGPYRQSQRTAIYLDVVEKLKASGHLYESFVTPQEMEERNVEAGRDPRQGYDNFERDLTEAERVAFRAEGRIPSLRLRVPDTDLSPVDDALMGVTHVFRGEDILSSTPRQIALYLALIEAGVTTFIPQFAHMPLVYGEGAKKLSKRDPESNLFHHRERGFIPEGLINYLALLGWSIAADRDVFTVPELTAAFDIRDVNPNPARFDQKKADAINGDHIRMLAPDDFAERLLPYLGGLVATPPTVAEAAILREAAPLVQERMTVLSEAPGLLAFLFTPDDALEFETDALPKDTEQARRILEASVGALEGLDDFATAAIEEALRAELIEGAGLKPRDAFGPLRTGISGRRISPPLFESMEILGKASTLARLERFRQHLG
jgi:glutamyl-tRNA synthetase